MLYVYLACNLGGVSSVVRERIAADRDSRYQVYAVLRHDAGGCNQMSQLGVRLTIDHKYIERSIQVANQEGVDSLHLVDEIEHAPEIRSHYHGQIVLELHSSTPRYFDQISRETIGAVDRIIVPSLWSRDQVRARLTSLGLSKEVNVLPNIAMFPAAQHSPRGSAVSSAGPTILWVGKLTGTKNWLDALRICSRVRQEHERCRFVFVTGGAHSREQAEWFVNEILALDLAVDWRHNIRRETMSALYSNAARTGGALLVTTMAESFGMVVVESLAHGLPVLCTSTHALPELIKPGINGETFPVGDTLQPSRILSEILSKRRTFSADSIRATVPSLCHPDSNLAEFSRIVRAERVKDATLLRIVDHQEEVRTLDVFGQQVELS